MADFEDLFKEMSDKTGQSNSSYFPFPSKIFALYLLVNSPRIPCYDLKINIANC